MNAMNKPTVPYWLSAERTRGGVQFLKFAFVGGTATALHYAIFLALVMFGGVAPGLAAAIGTCFGACVVYTLNRRYTFTTQRSHGEMIPRFVALSVLGALLNGAIVTWLTGAGLHFLLSQVVATIFVLFINFGVSKKWIYR
jgi:putative flippase GtrA